MPLNPDTTLDAHLSALAFLGTGIVMVAGAAIVAALLARQKRHYAWRGAKLLLAFAIVYAAALGVFSLISREKTLARGAEKHFCEIDCHLAYSVTGIRQVEALPGTATWPRYNYLAVAIKTRFDETTIAPSRGNGLLYPSPRDIRLIDDQGDRLAPERNSAAAEALLGIHSTDLATPLRPGQSYETALLFAVPAGTRNPRLLFTQAHIPQLVLIGQENSVGHAKTYFRLDQGERAEKLF